MWGVIHSFRAKNAYGGYGDPSGYALVVEGGKVTGKLGGPNVEQVWQSLNDSFVSKAADCPIIDPARVADAMK